MSPRPLALSVLVLLLAACQHAAPRVTAPAADTVPAHDNLNAVLWVQTSAEYRALTDQAYRAATAQLDRALRSPDWDALLPGEREAPVAGLPPAVILDIDETVLDNSPYQARRLIEGAEYDRPSWAAWVEEKRAEPVPGVVDFARAASARGIRLFYVSNRAQSLQAPTLANLRAAGLPVPDDAVFLGKGLAVPGCAAPDDDDKACRRRLVSRGYRVLMQFGDQLGDFVGLGDGMAAARSALLQTHGAWLGERWWLLPNPTYGSWESAPFHDDWQRTPDARRAAKRAALRTQ